MSWFALPVFVGAVLIVQSGFNDFIQEKNGLTFTLLTNNIVFFAVTILLSLTQFFGLWNPSEEYGVRHPLSFQWWYILPGMMGLIIVGGTALAFGKLGAAKTMVYLIGSQIVVGFAWDYFVKHKDLSGNKVIAGLLIVAASFLASRD